MKTFATYLRVSTQKQGAQGLGIEAQRKMCADFIENSKGKHVQEFMDVESGSHRDRKGLWQAIDYCKKNDCGLVIAKLDRLARDVEFTFKVINTGIEIHFTDMPQVNTMILGVFASVAQYERELVSSRTKAALNAKKARGEKLGAASDNYTITKENLQQRAKNAGNTRTRRVLEKRETQALMMIMRRVFPECANRDSSEWEQSFVSVRRKERIEFLTQMKNYNELDNELFAKWDLSDLESQSLQHKLASKLQSIIKMLHK